MMGVDDIRLRGDNKSITGTVFALIITPIQRYRRIAAHAPKADYQKETTDSGESQLEMVRKLELDETAHIGLLTRCQEKGIQILAKPFDLLVRLGLNIFKIPSGEITFILDGGAFLHYRFHP